MRYDLARAERLQVEGTLREMSNQWKEAIAIWQDVGDVLSRRHRACLAPCQRSDHLRVAEEGLATIRRLQTTVSRGRADPRLEIAESSAAETVSDYKRAQTAALAAATTAQIAGCAIARRGSLAEGGCGRAAALASARRPSVLLEDRAPNVRRRRRSFWCSPHDETTSQLRSATPDAKARGRDV
jgi:hypothetical protein